MEKKVSNLFARVSLVGAVITASLGASLGAYLGATPCFAESVDAKTRPELIELLQQDSKAATAAIDATETEKIPDETIDAAFRCIRGGSCSQTAEEIWKLVFVNDREGSRIAALISDMMSKGKFRVLTDGTRKRLHLDRFLCRTPEHCTTIAGFYLPLTGHLFLDTSLPWPEQLGAFVHELYHAYQFTYRLPLDLGVLFEDVHEGTIKKSDLGEYLDFFYEAQANWKGLHTYPDPLWVPYETDPKALAEKYKKLGKSPPGQGFLGAILGHYRIQKYLPKMERTSLLGSSAWGQGPSAISMSILEFTELVCAKDVDPNIDWDNYDFPFFAKYCSSVERTYFGKLPFLFQNNRDDLAIFNSLHDNYFDKIGGNDRVGPDADDIRGHFSHLNKKCVALLEKIRAAETSPMVAWLSLSKAEMGSCPAYSGSLSEADSSDFIRSILTPYDPASPFSLIMLTGGEGGSPGLKLQPSLGILPQLKVLPSASEDSSP